MTERSPTIAMNKATSSALNPITRRKYTKKHEYCPASGKYDKKTAMHSIRIILSFPTFLREAKGSACSQSDIDVRRNFSGKDSGTNKAINMTSTMAMIVANNMTRFSLYKLLK